MVAAARERGVNLWADGDDAVQISVSEATTGCASGRRGRGVRADAPGSPLHASALPEALTRTSEFLTHPVFHAHRSETAMLRYLRRLSDMDLALDRTMIPLGSCTMKLNATTEMEAVTWPEFASLHPFAPVEDAAGLLELIDQLSDWLCEITGYAAVSLQPNAGSQGELAGLLAIRAYHRSRGDEGRTDLPDPGQRARHQRGVAR